MRLSYSLLVAGDLLLAGTAAVLDLRAGRGRPAMGVGKREKKGQARAWRDEAKKGAGAGLEARGDVLASNAHRLCDGLELDHVVANHVAVLVKHVADLVERGRRRVKLEEDVAECVVWGGGVRSQRSAGAGGGGPWAGCDAQEQPRARRTGPL